jgi:hypothetical protein
MFFVDLPAFIECTNTIFQLVTLISRYDLCCWLHEWEAEKWNDINDINKGEMRWGPVKLYSVFSEFVLIFREWIGQERSLLVNMIFGIFARYCRFYFEYVRGSCGRYRHGFFFYLQMDVGNNVTSFCRNILSVDVERLNNSRCVK